MIVSIIQWSNQKAVKKLDFSYFGKYFTPKYFSEDLKLLKPNVHNDLPMIFPNSGLKEKDR